MRRYFVDTWYLIALTDRFDANHLAARRIEPITRGPVLVTHEAVLTEFLTFFADAGPMTRQMAVRRVRTIFEQPQWTVARSSELFSGALDFYAHRLDKAYSLVDCMSMVLMNQQKITHVLTNDHHFRQEGFTVVNE
jgi:predicted nucleic acid-binding protein